MTRGRKSKIKFGLNHPHIGEMATRANNTGVYTVESLEPGIYYFCDNDEMVVATVNGHLRMNIDIALLVANEIKGIANDYRQAEGRTPMSSRQISKMLENDT